MTTCLVLAAGIAACHRNNTQQVNHVGPETGESTAPAPSDPSVPAPDSAGVPPVDQPLDPQTSTPATGELRTAQNEPMAVDAGVPLRDGGAGDGGMRDGGIGSGSGSGSGSGARPK
jgi:hypothetical protein